MTSLATGHPPRYRQLPVLAFPVVVLAECLLVFGWSLQLPAFVAFGLGAGALGLLDWRPEAIDRLFATGLAVAAVILLVGAAVFGDGVTGLVAPTVSALVVGSMLGGLRLALPRGLGRSDVGAGTFAAFVLGSLGWAPVVAAVVGAFAVSAVIATGRIIRTGERAVDPLPFSAALACSSLLVIGLGL